MHTNLFFNFHFFTPVNDTMDNKHYCNCCAAEFIDYVVGGLKYNDVSVQLASVYICIQLYSRGPAGHSSQMVQYPRVTQKLVHDVVHLLKHANHDALISSLVGQYNSAFGKSSFPLSLLQSIR